MPLQFHVEALDDLAPEVAALYIPDPKRGGHMLDVDTPDTIKRALVSERDARSHAERAAKAAEVRAAGAEVAIAERNAALATAAALRLSMLDMQVREAARVAGLHAAAIPDAVRAAKELFDVGDDGALKAKDGKTSVDKWLAAAKDEAPHWFPATGSGSGSSPAAAGRSSGRADTMTRRAFDALPAAQRAALARSGSITIKD